LIIPPVSAIFQRDIWGLSMPDTENNNTDKKTGQITVVIDVGHGNAPKSKDFPDGWDTGIIAYKLKGDQNQYIIKYPPLPKDIANKVECFISEQELNAQNALLLRKELETRGYKVILTTDEGERPSTIKEGSDYTSRHAVAYKHNADLYISLHTNNNRSTEPEGPRVYLPLYWLKKPNISPKSIEVANSMIQALKEDGFEIGDNPSALEPKVSDRLFSLKKIPGVLFETGFISNQADRTCLMDFDHCKSLMNTIADGIDKFFGKEKKIEKSFEELVAEAKGSVQFQPWAEQPKETAPETEQPKIDLKKYQLKLR
jgi:N-acetylmuramoyl-L-alanine amidase